MNTVLENIFLFFAFVNIIGFLSDKNFLAIIVFFVSLVLTGYYTTNRLYIIGVALLLANVINGGNRRRRREGMEGNGNVDSDDDDDDDNDDDDSDDDSEDDKSKKTTGLNALSDIIKSQESFEDSDDQTLGKRIDYSTTLEQAYSNLQNILGNDGIKGLTDQTQQLLGQQKNLMDSLTQMAPVINNAQDTLKKFNLPGVSELFKK
jgi:hypothetical protein